MMKRMKTIAALIVMLGSVSGVHAERTLEHEAVIPGPVSEVWTAFTTSDGFMSWAVPKAEVDLRIGGEMRTSYNPESDLNDEHTIVNRILAYEPERMLAIQNVQAPEGFANAHLFQETWSVIHFEPVGPNATRVRTVGIGYGEGPEWDDIYEKFRMGNAWTLEKLRQKFAPGTGEGSAADAKQSTLSALDILRRFVGGEWIHEGAGPDGSVFRVRNVLTLGADGASIIGEAWLGGADGMFDHGDTIIYRQPGTGRTMFFNINEAGAVSTGEVHAVDENAVEWDWRLTDLEGNSRSFSVLTRFTDADHYQFTLRREGDDGAFETLVDVAFTRVETAPPAFHRMTDVDHDAE